MSAKKLRSKLEKTFEDILKVNQAEYEYEETKLGYTVPESNHVYNVDWTLANGILVETKGWLKDHQERSKYILIKQQYPEVDLRFVFANPNKFCGGMRTTHKQWAEKNGFKWCAITDLKTIAQWVKEQHA